ncbi:MAG: hypothetical protein ACE5ER_01650 [Nitrospinaceae bacterium]
MRRLIFFSNWLYLFSLALWVGGMFLLGILVEIVVRVKLKDQPDLASAVMNGIMDPFNTKIIYWCLGLMGAAVVIKSVADRRGAAGYTEPVVTKRRYTKEACLIIMAVVALYIGSVLRPEMHAMDRMKKANPADVRLQRQFDGYHSQLTWLYTVNMILGLALFYIHGKEMTRFEDNAPTPASRRSAGSP